MERLVNLRKACGGGMYWLSDADDGHLLCLSLLKPTALSFLKTAMSFLKKLDLHGVPSEPCRK